MTSDVTSTREDAPDTGAAAPAAGGDADRPVLSVRDLRVWYGTGRGNVRAVDGVDFDVRPGETLGLVGESGCGKSTLGRGVLGLTPEGSAVDGEVNFRGRNLVGMPPKGLQQLRGPELGLIFQEPMTRLNPLIRISEHFTETLKTHEPGLSKQQIRERSLEALRGMGIPPSRYNNYPHEFSGGMRQRIMIALALVLRPAFVVADEPTTALDVLVEAQIIRILADLRKNFDTALVLITHNLGIVAEACDRVAVMYAGRIVEQGDANEVFARPQHPYTQELLRSTISLRTTGLHSIPGSPPDLVEPPSGCSFHPRCPDAMRMCAAVEPPEVRLRTGTTSACWQQAKDIPGAVPEEHQKDGREPLRMREEISVADEA